MSGLLVDSLITALPPGGSVTFTITGVASANPGVASNTATIAAPSGVSDPVSTNNASTASTNVIASADVSIVKTGPASVVSGATIAYTLMIANAGPSAANGASYSDVVPAAITGVAANCAGAGGGAACTPPTVAGNSVSGSVPVLPAGGSVTIAITGTAPFGTTALTNTATITPPAGTGDPDTGNDSSTVVTAVGAAADIAVAKSVDNAAPNVGDTVTFTIVAINDGPDDATGVAVTDGLPFGLGFVSASATQGSYDSGTGLWTVGALADGADATLTLVASVDDPGPLTNTATVSAADQPDPDTSNNSSGVSLNAGASADLSVLKTVDDATPNVGETVAFTIALADNGPNDATGIEITDLLPAGLTFVSGAPSQGTYDDLSGVWTVGDLANGAGATLVLTATVDNAGAITNIATITAANENDPAPGNNESGAAINGQLADIAVLKTVDNVAPDVGDDVTFTITVHDNGPSDATGVAITDALPAGLAFVSANATEGAYDSASDVWTVGALTAAGASSTATLTIVATVQQDGALTNTATVTASDQPDPNAMNDSASVSLNGNPLADLSIVKSGPATVTPGDTLVYSVTVSNNGPSDAANVVIADATPAGLVFVGNSGACSSAYPCSLPSLASGDSATITSTYTVPADYSGANPIVNTAAVASDTPDPNAGNDESSASTAVGAGQADLSIVKSGPASVAAGGAITYTLVIANAGPSPANGASYMDVVPAGITAIAASCGGESGGGACVAQPGIVGNTVSGTVGTLPSGGSVVVTITGTAPDSATTLSNTATIAAPPGIDDPNPGNDTSSVATDVVVGAASADLGIVKSGPASAQAGAQIAYALTITNAGPDSAASVVVDDPAPAGLAFVSASMPCAGGFPCTIGDLAPGASTIVSVTFMVDAGAGGTLANTATVGSDTPDPNLADNTGSASTTILPVGVPSADLAVIKNGPATVAAGSEVTYSIVVTNAGPDDAVNAVLADPTPAGLTFESATAPCEFGFPCALGTLAGGQSMTIAATFAVGAGASGTVVNTASVSSDTSDPDTANSSSTATSVVTGGVAPPRRVPVPADGWGMLALLGLGLGLAGALRGRAWR